MRIHRAFALVVAGLGLLVPCSAADARAEEPVSLSNLSLEVMALQMLHRFEMTPEQLAALRRLAPITAAKSSEHEAGKGGDPLRQALVDLRDALVRGAEERIGTLEEQLDELQNADDTDLDDVVELTPMARRRAAVVLQALSPRQVGAFLNSADELPDPLERLLNAIDQARQLDSDSWQELTEEVVEELSWQLGGLDPERGKRAGERVEQLLKAVRAAKDLVRRRPEFEQSARQLVGQVLPTVVLHNYAEHALAELLSNPLLAAALDARMGK